MLTREEILALPAGVELNMLVMEHVLDYKWCYTNANVPWLMAGVSELKPPSWYKNGDTLEPWLTMEGVEIRHGHGQERQLETGWNTQYSTDIAFAWVVLKAMRAKGWYSQHTDLTLDSGAEWWSWTFLNHAPPGNESVTTQAKTAPLAICRAALLALLASPTPSQNS